MSVRDAKVVVADGGFGTAAVRNKLSDKKPKGFSFLGLYYPVNEVLGSGAYARVETFRSVADGNEFAVKIVEAFGNEKCRQKVFKEIEIYSLCSGHPHIIDLKEYFEEDGRFYLVFPRMASSLFETIVARGKLTELEAANVVRQITSGLAYLHSKGIAHRDIKPENILAKDLSIEHVVICDFDLGSPVKLVREGRSTTPALLTPVGSAEFMAPEVVDAWLTDNATKYDKKCDLWSLGVITYVLLCGYAPFNGDCGAQCGWRDLGKYCHDCQMDLFARIQSCQIEFPEAEWGVVSQLAKDFVRHLLVREARIRPSAVELLNNQWLITSQPGDKERVIRNAPLLATPSTLKTNNALSLSFLLERSNDAYRRQSLFQDQLGDCLLLAPLPAAKFRLGSDDEGEDPNTDIDDPAAKNGEYPDEQLMATTPRAGTGNLMALYTELAKSSTWSSTSNADDEYSNAPPLESNYPASLVNGDFNNFLTSNSCYSNVSVATTAAEKSTFQ